MFRPAPHGCEALKRVHQQRRAMLFNAEGKRKVNGEFLNMQSRRRWLNADMYNRLDG